MDRILIKGLRVFAYHGVNPEEKRDGQTFVLDVSLYTSLRRAGETDCLEDTVNYSAAVKTVLRVMNEKVYDLIERAAARVAEELLSVFPSLERVDVLLKKPHAPVKAEFEYMAVEISRERADFS